MITRLFRSRPRLDSKDPADRIAAIEALSDDDARRNESALIKLAIDDADPAVRLAATDRLDDEQTLRTLLGDSALAGRAIARILELNAKGRCTGLAAEPRVLAAQLGTVDDPEALIGRLLVLGGNELLVDALLGTDRNRRKHLLSLSVLYRLDVLQELERRSRDRDKNTNRYARQQIDSIRRQAAAVQSLAAAVEESLSGIEKPADETIQTERARRAVLRERIEQNLGELDDLMAVLASTGADVPSIEPLRQRFLAVQTLQADAAEAPIGAAGDPNKEVADTDSELSANAPEQPNGQFDDLTAGFQALDARLATESDIDALAAERQRLTDLWLSQTDQAPPSDHQHAIFEQVSQRFQELAVATARLQKTQLPSLDPDQVPELITSQTAPDAWRAVEQVERDLKNLIARLNTIAWPAWAATPETLAEQQQLIGAARQRLADWDNQVQQTIRNLEGKLVSLESHIEAGELKSARSEASEIRRQLKPLPDRRTTELNRQLARASARLNELSDWQTFATAPKREALLAAMQAIADTPLPAADQAERIKTLRKEWNELGSMGRNEDHKLLDAFNEAAERAFEPCRSHFAEQAAIRAENLASREAICESLSQYLSSTDWSSADYKAAEHIMRTARDEWRAYHPVDRSAGRAVESRFEALQADLHQRIKSEWDRNLAAKQQIVTEAQALAGSDADVRDKVDGAKRLQQQWKRIGATPRRPDQNLWRDFRAACDTIFESLDSAKKSEDAEIQANRKAAEQLLTDFRTRLDDASNELDAGMLRTFQAEFDALPSLPERVLRPLERERDELVRAAQQVLRNQRAAREIARLTNLKAQDEAVTALELQQLDGETVQFTAPDPLFKDRCRPEATPVSAEALTRIVIEAEIAAGLESPESELRMAIQVEMMNAGRGREALEATPEALTRRWCELGPKTAAAAPLRDRFFEAIGGLLER